MDFPTEFLRLAFNTLFAFDQGFSSDEEFAKLVFEGLDGGRRKTLLEFLNRVLDGRYDDGQIEKHGRIPERITRFSGRVTRVTICSRFRTSWSDRVKSAKRRDPTVIRPRRIAFDEA